MQIVKVKYYSETNGLSPREYTYYSVDTLKVGDLVTVPVRDTTGKAQVSAIDISELEIAAFKDKVKVIPSGSIVKNNVLTYQGEIDRAEAEALFPDTRVDDPYQIDSVRADALAARQVVIYVKPELDEAVNKLQDEIIKLKKYALTRVIKTDTDLSPVVDDLALISKLKKALTEKMDEYTSPIKGHLVDIQGVFNPLIAHLKEAEATNKAKITTYTDAQKERAAEAERLNREAIELARKQAEFSGTGEITVDISPLEAPAPVHKVSTMSGSFSEVKAPSTWEIENEALIPREYYQLDVVKVNKVIRAGVTIPGIKTINHTTIRTNTK